MSPWSARLLGPDESVDEGAYALAEKPDKEHGDQCYTEEDADDDPEDSSDDDRIANDR